MMQYLVVLVLAVVAVSAGPVKDVDLCLDCKTLFADVKARLVAPKTSTIISNNINKYFCDFLLIGKEPCRTAVKTFVTTGLGTMAQLIDPNMICTLLMYCQVTPHHATEIQQHLSETMDLAKRFLDLSTKEGDDPDLCADCTTMFTDLKARLVNPAFVTQITTLASKYTCNLIPIPMAKTTCETFMGSAISTGLNAMAALINPNMICSLLMYCTPAPPQVMFHKDDLHLFDRFFSLSAKSPYGDEPDLCVDCTTLFTDVKSRLANPTTTAAIAGLVNKYFCNFLPIGKEQCSQMVTVMIQTSMGFMANLIKPSLICTMLMYCQPSPPTLYFQPMVLPERSLEDVDLCLDCKNLFTDVKARLTAPMFAATIAKQLETYTCNLLPMLKTECNMFVSTAITMALNSLASLVNANMLCQMLMYCSA